MSYIVLQVLTVSCAAVRFVETPQFVVAVTATDAHCDGAGRLDDANEQGRSSSS